MLTKIDEYPVHQIAETFAGPLSSDPSWNDGHYLCLCDMDGRIALASTVRLYKNNDVLEGFVCIRHQDRQHNIRLTRRLRPNIDHYGVGPLQLQIIEPLRTVRLLLEDNDYGVSCDVTCHSSAIPYEEARDISRIEGRLLTERVVYDVTGTCVGTISIAGQRYAVNPDEWFFFRNHSWGIMPGRGGPRLGSAPLRQPPEPMRGLRNWVLYRMPDHAGFYQLFEEPDGRRRASEGAILYPDRSVRVSSIEHDLRFYPDSDRMQSGHFVLTDEEGNKWCYDIEDLGWIYCQGGGYFGGFDDGLGMGVYRGDEHREGEVWDVSHPTRVVTSEGVTKEFTPAWAENFVRVRRGGQIGLAHFECVVFRP